VCVLLYAGLASAAQAETQWIQPTPEELAMTSEPKAPGAAAVYLYREEITDEADSSESFYVRLKVLTEKGRSYADISLDYINDSYGFNYSIAKLEARTIHSDGTVIPFTGKPVDQLVEKERGYKVRQKIFTLPDVQVGSIVEYRYKLQCSADCSIRPFWKIQQDVFLKTGHFLWKTQNNRPIAATYVLPKGYEVKITTSEGGLFKAAYRNYELNINDVKPVVDEGFTPPLRSYSYRVNFYVVYAANETEFWKRAGAYWSLGIESFISPPLKAQDVLKTLVAPGDSDTVKLQKIYAAIMAMDNTRYLRSHDESEDRAGKLKPLNSTLDIWQLKRGTDDQLTDLFVTLARAAGMKAYVMKVTSRDNDIFSSKWFSTEQLDDNIAIVVLDGKEKYFDPGQRYCPFGQLSWMHSSVTGMRQIDGGETALVTTTLDPYGTSKVYRVADLTMTADGHMQGTLKITFWGAPALEWRQKALTGDVAAMRTEMHDWIQNIIPTGLEVTLTTLEHLEDYEQPLTANLLVSGQLGTVTAKRVILPGQFFEAQSKPLFPSANRQLPVYFHYQNRVLDAVRVKLPAELKVESAPNDDTFSMPHATGYSTKVELHPDFVTMRRVQETVNILFPISDYPELQKFYNHMAEDDEKPIILSLQTTAAQPAAPVVTETK
jgi:hypothetical protein